MRKSLYGKPSRSVRSVESRKHQPTTETDSKPIASLGPWEATSDAKPEHAQTARQPPWNGCKRCVLRAVQLHNAMPCGPGRLSSRPLGHLSFIVRSLQRLASFLSLWLVGEDLRMREAVGPVWRLGLAMCRPEVAGASLLVRSASTLTCLSSGCPELTGRPCSGPFGSPPGRRSVGLCQPGSPTR